ncbi:molybdate ABC transporter substrate-binding protein [Aquicoccus porphyridii]|nr:molybdate ABC transporter substrate-binding protein [Aquicoccus porphyridii]
MPPFPMRRFLGGVFFLLALGFGPLAARAETALAAVAANFAETAEALVPLFREATGHDLVLTTGSTGKLYAQIGAGAPFDLLLSADAATPARLLDEGKAVAGSDFTYAIGRLTLWSGDAARIGTDGQAVLRDPDLRFVAIANPDLAPYGVAAREALESMGLWAALQPKIVMGQNIGQTHSLVATGAAELGFVALSAVKSPRAVTGGSRWDVPQALFTPIRQDAVLLNPGAGNDAARAFLAFLRSDQAARVIERFGYGAGG